MKFLSGALATLLVAGPAFASTDPKIHKLCLEARDYAGCVKSMTAPPTQAEDELTPLRSAMKQVAARLRSGTSLRDSTLTFQPVTDQLALVSGTHPDELAVTQAKLASNLFDALQFAWNHRIEATAHQLNQYASGGELFYGCKILKATVDNWNRVPSAPQISWDYKKGLFGANICRVPSGQLPENYMYPHVVRILEQGSISPAEIAARKKAQAEREAKAARERELCAMGPWNRYLEENPGMKKWAEANPAAAEDAKKKFLAKPENQKECGVPASQLNLKGINYSDFYR